MTKGNFTSLVCHRITVLFLCSDVTYKQFSRFGKSLLARYVAVVITIYSMCEDHLQCV